MNFQTKNMKYLIVFCCVLLCGCSYAQTPSTSKQYSSFPKANIQELKGYYFNANSALPKEFDFSGRVDYTQFIQKLINENDVLLLPNCDLLINESGINIGSNKIVIFDSKTKFIQAPNSAKSYGLIKIINSQNVKIYNANLVGDRYNHYGNEGEWGMGIDIRSSQNIMIYSPKIENSFGDGIYLGIKGPNVSDSITINDAWVNNSRRNGISITSGKNIYLNRPYVANSKGINPQAGIDIEPNNYSSIIDNIVINDAITYKNTKEGILFYLDKLGNMKTKIMNAKINNHTDYYSSNSFRVSKVNNPNAIANISLSNTDYVDPKAFYLRIDNIDNSNIKVKLTGYKFNGNKRYMNQNRGSKKVSIMSNKKLEVR